MTRPYERGERGLQQITPEAPPESRRGLTRSRESGGVFGRLKALFSGPRQLDAGLAREIEDVLLSSDVGAAMRRSSHASVWPGMKPPVGPASVT